MKTYQHGIEGGRSSGCRALLRLSGQNSSLYLMVRGVFAILLPVIGHLDMFLAHSLPLFWVLGIAHRIGVFCGLTIRNSTMQIVLERMIKESTVFFTLLSFLLIGFVQTLTGLDIADQSRDDTESIVNSLIQALLG
jgi:glucan phosphoethanolaminetransferase (alkaline phosphatase superfamily)